MEVGIWSEDTDALVSSCQENPSHEYFEEKIESTQRKLQLKKQLGANKCQERLKIVMDSMIQWLSIWIEFVMAYT